MEGRLCCEKDLSKFTDERNLFETIVKKSIRLYFECTIFINIENCDNVKKVKIRERKAGHASSKKKYDKFPSIHTYNTKCLTYLPVEAVQLALQADISAALL